MPSFQYDIKRNEIAKSTGGSIIFNAEVAGSGSVDVSSATATIYNNGGISQGGASLNISGSQVEISIPAGLTYDEYYKVFLEYQLSGSSQTKLHSITFDVCYEPWGDPLVGYYDIIPERINLSGILDNLGATFQQTPIQMASYYAFRAHQELDIWIRNKSAGQGKIRARAILDKDRLANIELKLAIAFIYKAISDGLNQEGTEETIFNLYKKDAETSFAGMSGFRYDDGDDGIGDAEKQAFGNVLTIRRAR